MSSDIAEADGTGKGKKVRSLFYDERGRGGRLRRVRLTVASREDEKDLSDGELCLRVERGDHQPEHPTENVCPTLEWRRVG